MSDLSAVEVARRLGIHPSLVRVYIRQGRIETTRIRPYMVAADEVARFEASPRSSGRPAGGRRRRT